MSEEFKPSYEQQNAPPYEIRAKMPSGLIATGLVAIVGSWFGMAVYMNHRLTDLEKGIRSENTKVVSSVSDNSNKLSDKFDTMQLRINTKVDETSSVLAKGILELTESESKHHTEVISSVKLSQNTIASAIEKQQEAQAKVISDTLNTFTKTNESNSEQVLSIIKDTKESLEYLVKNGIENQENQLSALANAIEQLPKDDGEKSKVIHTQLSALSNRIQEFQQQLSSSQQSVDQLNEALPQWKQDTSSKISVLHDQISQYESKSVARMKQVQEQVMTLQQNTNQSSENLLKTLYLTTEGLEGTKYELKSEVETMKASTKQDFNNLSESIDSISASLNDIKKDISINSIETTGLEFDGIEDVIDSAQLFSLNAHELHSKLQSHVDEVNAWLEKNNNGSPINRERIKKMLKEYQSYLDQNTQKISMLKLSVDEIQNKISSSDVVEDHSEESSADSGNEQETAMHPEERTESEVGVSLY